MYIFRNRDIIELENRNERAIGAYCIVLLSKDNDDPYTIITTGEAGVTLTE